MAKGPLVTSYVKEIIASVNQKHTKWKAPEVRNEVDYILHKRNPKLPPKWPSLSTVQKVLAILNKPKPPDPQDKIWSIASLPKYPIPPEALPVVLKIWAKSQEDKNFLTIREALWVSRLYCVFKGPRGESAIDLDLLRATTYSLALKEQAYNLLGIDYPSNEEDMTSFRLEDAHLYSEVAYGPPSAGDIMTRITKKLLGGTNERSHRKER